MSAMPIALLLTTAATAAVGVAVLRTLLGLRGQVVELRSELAEHRASAARGLVPAARSAADTDEIRAAVTEALAEERERELAEARAFWAAQEARDASDAPSLLGLTDSELFTARPSDFAGLEFLETVTEPDLDAEEFSPKDFTQGGSAGDSPSWPPPAAVTPRTRTSYRSSRPSRTTTNARWPAWRSSPSRVPSWRTSAPARSAPSTSTSSRTGRHSA